MWLHLILLASLSYIYLYYQRYMCLPLPELVRVRISQLRQIGLAAHLVRLVRHVVAFLVSHQARPVQVWWPFVLHQGAFSIHGHPLDRCTLGCWTAMLA